MGAATVYTEETCAQIRLLFVVGDIFAVLFGPLFGPNRIRIV